MTEVATETSPAPDITLSESAANRIAWLMGQEEHKGLMLRISVSGGGCSGFQYGFAFDDTMGDEDRLFERNGAKVVVDEVSLGLLGGAVIDYVEDLVGASFQIKNPNAKSSCGCGNSFAV